MIRTDNKLSIRFGIIGGLLFAAICFACWKAGAETFATFLVWDKFFPILLILFTVGAFQARKQRGGFWNFKDALAFAFLAYVIFEVIYAIVIGILFNVIDPQLQNKVLAVIVERTKHSLENIKTPGTNVNELLENTRRDFQGRYTFGQIVLGVGFSLVIDFIKSIIIAAITARPNPELSKPNVPNS